MHPRPVILVVQDDPRQLSALLDVLTRRFGADYRVIAHLSPKSALEELQALKASGEPTALVIADQWMSEMKGIEVLARVGEIDPDAKRGLLVPWGDHRSAPVILQGCAFGKLDNYLLKPWAPAEVHLYPLVSEFLSEWTRAHGPKMEIVRIIGEDLEPRAHELGELFERNGIPHGFYSARSAEGERLLRETGNAQAKLPVVILLDGRALANPGNTELADALGISSRHIKRCDVAIVGAGPAGLAAAVYAASEGLRTVVVECEALGGQAGTSSLIRNYLGFPRGISGAELAQRAYQQAWLFGAKYVFAREVTGLTARGEGRILTLSDGREITARAVIIATGATYRRIGIPNLERFLNAGVFYTSMTDSRVIKGHDVHVIGGGNSAGQAVVYLAEHARRVTLLVRGDSIGRTMSDYLVQQIRHLPNVEVRLNTEVIDGGGDGVLEYITTRDRRSGQTGRERVEWLFVLIGAQPHTEWLDGVVRRDRHGFILTGPDVGASLHFETSLPGVFAIGDVRAGSIKRVASAVGEGGVAMHFIHEYLESPVDMDAGRRREPARAGAAAPSDRGDGAGAIS